MLTKAPNQYSDAKQLPHVVVASRLQELGRPVRAGVVIPYVICIVEGSSHGLSSRAFHPDEVLKSSLKLDKQWYKTTQLLQPIGRLCAHIDGTSLHQLAECLGLNGSQYVDREAEIEITMNQFQSVNKDDLHTTGFGLPIDHALVKPVFSSLTYFQCCRLRRQ